MSRPKPIILQELRHSEKIYQILQAESVWVILYKGKPINLTVNTDPLYSLDARSKNIRYQRTIFLNEAHAYHRANKLQQVYRLDDITVKRIDFNDHV